MSDPGSWICDDCGNEYPSEHAPCDCDDTCTEHAATIKSLRSQLHTLRGELEEARGERDAARDSLAVTTNSREWNRKKMLEGRARITALESLCDEACEIAARVVADSQPLPSTDSLRVLAILDAVHTPHANHHADEAGEK